MPSVVSSVVNNARREIGRLRLALLAPGPEEIECTIPSLEAAVEDLRTADPNHVGEFREELEGLRADLVRVAHLLESGSALHQGWARVVGAAIGGYTASGSAATLKAPARVSVEG